MATPVSPLPRDGAATRSQRRLAGRRMRGLLGSCVAARSRWPSRDGRLALAVGCPGIVLAIRIEVVEVGFRGPVGNGGEDDDTGIEVR